MKRKRIRSTNASEVFCPGWILLYSYNTPVAAYQEGVGYFRTEEKYSATTTKHINKWLEGVNASLRPEQFFFGIEIKVMEHEMA